MTLSMSSHAQEMRFVTCQKALNFFMNSLVLCGLRRQTDVKSLIGTFSVHKEKNITGLLVRILLERRMNFTKKGNQRSEKYICLFKSSDKLAQ